MLSSSHRMAADASSDPVARPLVHAPGVGGRTTAPEKEAVMSDPTGQPQGGGPPSWQQPPQQPVPPAPAQSWQQAPQQPIPPSAPQQAPSWTANLTSTAAVAGPAGYVYGDVPNRMIAFVIDWIIVGILAFVLEVIVRAVLGRSLGTSIVVLAITVGVSAGYFVWLWSSRRSTAGMQLLGLQVGN